MALDKIKGLTIEKEKYLNMKEETILVSLENGQSDSDVAVLRTEETRELKKRIEERIENL